MSMPGFRPVDPDKEVARLIAERNKRAEVPSWPVLVDEIRQVPGETEDDGMIFVHLRIAADRRHVPVPDGLGEKLTEVIAANWPARNG